MQLNPVRLSFTFDPLDDSSKAFDFDAAGMHDFQSAEDPKYQILVWGTPAINGRILHAKELLMQTVETRIEDLAPELDCSFLLVIREKLNKQIAIVTDRWSSLPIYYGMQGTRFFADTHFKSIVTSQGGSTRRVDRWAVAEFLYFRRMFGTQTLDPNIKCLPYGSILWVRSNGDTKLSRYWEISGEKTKLSRGDQAEYLAEGIRDSMRMYMSDGGRYGLLLSGGLDGRALLAGASQPLTCLTTSPNPNNELRVAQALAKIADSKHVYIQRPLSLPSDIVESSVALSGGTTVYHEAQFLGYESLITPHSDVIFMGLALDIMFCGHYLPKSLVRVLGRDGMHFRLQKLPHNIEDDFIKSVTYRLKSSNPINIIRSDIRAEFQQKIFERVSLQMQEGRAIGLEGYDLWEFMHLHNLSRHYSLLMAQSIRTFAACRVPAFSRQLYDICWGMRAEDKANWSIYQKAIKRLSPVLMRERNANSNMRADLPLRIQTFLRFAKSIGNRLPSVNVRMPPAPTDRSWPSMRTQLESNPELLKRALLLGQSEKLASLELFDMKAISALIRDHVAGSVDHTVLINMLQTIECSFD